MSYEDLTTGDPNPLKRWLQGRRFSDALHRWEDPEPRAPVRVLDFGGGNGELLRRMTPSGAVRATLYEPASYLMEEALERLAGYENIRFVSRPTDLRSGDFHYVFCLEVFEHLPEEETREALEEIRRVLAPGGRAVIGVPVEVHLPALVKGIFRMSRRYGEYDATPRHVWSATVGAPPGNRPVAEIGSGLRYHPYHLGFDHRSFRHLVSEFFTLEETWGSPFPFLEGSLSLEQYYLARKPD